MSRRQTLGGVGSRQEGHLRDLRPPFRTIWLVNIRQNDGKGIPLSVHDVSPPHAHTATSAPLASSLGRERARGRLVSVCVRARVEWWVGSI